MADHVILHRERERERESVCVCASPRTSFDSFSGGCDSTFRKRGIKHAKNDYPRTDHPLRKGSLLLLLLLLSKNVIIAAETTRPYGEELSDRVWRVIRRIERFRDLISRFCPRVSRSFLFNASVQTYKRDGARDYPWHERSHVVFAPWIRGNSATEIQRRVDSRIRSERINKPNAWSTAGTNLLRYFGVGNGTCSIQKKVKHHNWNNRKVTCNHVRKTSSFVLIV